MQTHVYREMYTADDMLDKIAVADDQLHRAAAATEDGAEQADRTPGRVAARGCLGELLKHARGLDDEEESTTR